MSQTTNSMKGQVRIVWMGDEVTKAFRAEVLKRIRLACELVKSHVQRNLGTSNQKGKNPSKPGQYPHAGSGQFRASVYARVNEETLEGFVGSDLPYATALEYGTKGGQIVRAQNAKALSWIGPDGVRRFAKFVRLGKIEARAPFRRGWLECEGRVRGILTSPINQALSK